MGKELYKHVSREDLEAAKLVIQDLLEINKHRMIDCSEELEDVLLYAATLNGLNETMQSIDFELDIVNDQEEQNNA